MLQSKIITAAFESRLGRGLCTLLAVGIIYSLYVTVITPLVEPTVLASQGTSTRGSISPTARYREQMANLFPEDAWELQDPKVLESGNIVLLLKDYRPLGDARLEIKPCTLIVYSEEKNETNQSPRPIILQAPEGAILTFDQEIDLGKASIGEMERGLLQGPVTIHSPESEPGANDALSVLTRNVQVDMQRVWTPHEVDLKYGPHEIAGRDFIITLANAAEDSSDSKFEMGPQAIASIELVHVEKVHIQTEGEDLFGASSPLAGASNMTGATNTAANAPQPSNNPKGWLEIACRGPFQFDMTQQVATFEEHVDVWRSHPEGPSDQLSCELLSIHFSAEASLGESSAAESALLAPSYQLGKIVAEGYPVILRAPSMEATARGERLEYDFSESRVSLESSRMATLTYAQSEIESPQLNYKIIAGSQIGLVQAEGAGRFHTNLEEGANNLTATWQEDFRVRPHEGMYLLSMVGEAKIHSSLSGAIESNEIHLWFREIASPATPRSNNVAGAHPPTETQIEPDRLMANGDVSVDSEQLLGRADRLEMWFEYQTPEASLPESSHNAANPSATPAKPPGSDPLSQANDRKYEVEGELVRALLIRKGNQTQIENITIEGNVRLAEAYRGAANESPMVVTGDLLQVRNADREAGIFHISGSPATVFAQGMTTTSKNIQIDRLANRLWIVGPGEMTTLLEHDLSGNKLPEAEPARIQWQDGFDFDGQSAHIGQGVQITTASQTATADMLDLMLSHRIDFAHPDLEGGEITLRQIGLKENVAIENRSSDSSGLLSIDKMQVHDLVIDQLTGQLRASGPGWISSVRRAESNAALLGGTTPGAQPIQPRRGEAGDGKLAYLRVEFGGRAEGDLNIKEIQFFDQVHTVYGEVENWEQTLEVQRTNESAGDAIRLECDLLAVREMGDHPSGRAAMEIEAIGRTLVEGRAFTARAQRISYSEAKDNLILEGDGRTAAELFHQRRIGGTVSRFAGRKILYGRSTGRIQVDDAQYLDLSEFGNFGE